MILQKLAEYYDRVTADPKTSDALPKPGYSTQKISFCVVLSPDGSLHQIETMMVPAGKRSVPQMKLVPGENKSSGQGLNPCFLWDTPGYMLGYKPKDKTPERTVLTFESFRRKHLDLEKEIGSPSYRAVCTFLRSWSTANGRAHAELLNETGVNFGVFRIAGEQHFVHEDPAVVSYWLELSQMDQETIQGLCLVTGVRQPIARVHEPKIRGVRSDPQPPGGGHLLVSFNDTAYESHGKEQSYNAPVGKASVFKYANALNYLLSREDRRALLGDATVVSWADKFTEDTEAISSFISSQLVVATDAAAEDKTRARQLQNFLQQLRDGHASQDAINPDDQTPFYILGLSPNVSRISVRFWISTTVSKMKENLGRHMRDVELVGASHKYPLTIRNIVVATGRAKDHFDSVSSYDTGSISPRLAGTLAHAILNGGLYPQVLLGTLLNRIRADGVVSYSRAASIKAILMRNFNYTLRPDAGDLPNDNADALGRVFAVLQKIEAASLKGAPKSTIQNRYFTPAASIPASVFPHLLQIVDHHLRRFDPELKNRRELLARGLQYLMCHVSNIPAHFTLPQRGAFLVGYFQEMQQ
jgi:CRISPR-associated protein Csd1